MKRKNRCRIVSVIVAAACAAGLGGCRETPDESAVVDKSDGISEAVEAEPLADGETRIIEVPERWEQTEKWNKDRWIFRADVELESVEAGNLPVVELKQRSMTQEELEELVEYFADGEELYVPLQTTKDVYQEKLDRIRNMEGVYSVYTIDTVMGDKADKLEQGLELAPEEGTQSQETAEIAFGPRRADPAEDAATDRRKYISEETDSMDLYFSADIGEDRESTISVRKYDPDAGLSGKFEWMTGDQILYQKSDIDVYQSMHAEYADVSDTDRAWEQLLDQCTAMMREQNIDQEEGRRQAEAFLEEMGITDKSCSYAEPVLWFPEGSYQEDLANTYYDSLWQADLSRAEAGYVYTFHNEISGLPVDLLSGGNLLGISDSGAETDSYAPPFPVESITVAVTESGVKMFSWTGMSETVSTVMENTSVLPFEKIRDRIVQYLSYCFPGSQPDDSESVFEYDLQDITFGYSYITAYENPDHAWAVPAWLVELKSGSDMYDLTGKREMENMQWTYLTVNALDGSVIQNR